MEDQTDPFAVAAVPVLITYQATRQLLYAHIEVQSISAYEYEEKLCSLLPPSPVTLLNYWFDRAWHVRRLALNCRPPHCHYPVAAIS